MRTQKAVPVLFSISIYSSCISTVMNTNVQPIGDANVNKLKTLKYCTENFQHMTQRYTCHMIGKN